MPASDANTSSASVRPGQVLRDGRRAFPALKGSIWTFRRRIRRHHGAVRSRQIPTFMNLLGCLDTPTIGDYFLAGATSRRWTRMRWPVLRNRTLGFVFQGFNLLPRMSLQEDNVALPLVYAGVDKGRTRPARRAPMLLAKVGLGKYAERSPAFPAASSSAWRSPGPGQPAAPDPADEPTGNLDSHTSEEIMAPVRGTEREGITIVLVTHEPDIAAHCKRQVRFLDGQIVSDHLTEAGHDPSDARRSLAAMGANRLRTALTMLGMVIGVGAVVIMMAIGQGRSTPCSRRSAPWAATCSSCSPVRRHHGRRAQQRRAAVPLNVADAEAIAELDGVVNVAPTIRARGNWSPARRTGVRRSSARRQVSRWRGRGPSAARLSAIPTCARRRGGDHRQDRGEENLFGDENPVGKTMRISKTPFIVIGVLGSKGQNLDGRDQDDTVIIPLSAPPAQGLRHAVPRFGAVIMVQADSDRAMPR